MRATDRRALGVVYAVAALARVGYWAAGVRFDAGSLSWYWQYADPHLLRHDYARTLWWFHAQPPAFDAFIGAVLHLPPSMQVVTFQLCFLTAGAVLLGAMYLLAVELAVPSAAAATITALVAVSPTLVVYENLLFYPVPVATFLVLTVLGVVKYLRTRARAWGACALGSATLLVFVRATYHLVWLVLLTVALLLAAPDLRRRTSALAAVPLVLATGLYVKNEVQTGSFAASTWMGMNLARVVVNETPTHDLEQLVARHRVSPQMLVPAFSPPDAYGRPDRRHTGVAVLDEVRKPDGSPNYNHWIYPAVSRRYLRDALRTIRARPGNYVRAVAAAYRIWLAPATDQPFVYRNMVHLRTIDRWYNRLVGWQPRLYFYPLTGARRAASYAPDAAEISWSAVVLYGLGLLVLPVTAVLTRRRKHDSASAWTVLVACATTWLVVVAGNALELGENSRFRVETDPLVWVLAAAAVTMLLRARRRRVPDAAATT